MGPRRAATLLLTGIALTDLMFRVAQVALPLVVLAATGSVAATGLVAGAAGVPVLLSPWWARRARHRVRSGGSIAACYVGEAVALASVPLAASTGALTWHVLLLAGLGLGVCEALDGPGRDALLADLGDQMGEDHAFALLTVRDLFRRAALVVGPALGGLAVAAGHGVLLLWIESGCVLVAAVLAAPVRAWSTVLDADAPRIWHTVREHRAVLGGWIVRGTGCFLWFGFTLGLALLGVERGQEGVYFATAMTSYGVGSLLGTPLAVPLLRRLPVLATSVADWSLTGGCWVLMGLSPTLVVIAGSSFVSSVAVVIGNAGVTALVTRSSGASSRRTLLAGQSVVVNSASSAGMLVGGGVLVLLGPATTLVASGCLMGLVATGVAGWARWGLPRQNRAAIAAARAPYEPPNMAACTSSGKS